MSYPKYAASPPAVAVGTVYLIADGSIVTADVLGRVLTAGGSWGAKAGTLTCDTTSGCWYYTPTQDETNGAWFIVAIYKASCTSASVTVVTEDTATAGKVSLAATQTTAITGDITGNLSGSVGSVTGDINTAAGTIKNLDALDTAQDVEHDATQAAVAAVQSTVNNIASVSAPSYEAPSSYTLTTGNQTGGTYANVDSLNGTYHVHTDAAGTLSLIYHFTMNPDEVANEVFWSGRWNGVNDTLLFEIYDWTTPGYVTWFTQVGVAGTTSASDFAKSVKLVAKYTGTGTDAGKVNVRITGSSLTSCTLSTDQLIVGKTTRAGGIANGSTLTLTGSNTNTNYIGNNWTLALGGQDISGSYFYGAKSVTGIASGSTDVTFENCDFGAATVPPGKYINCGFGLSSGTLTAASAGQYILRTCFSCVPGSGTPAFDWATGTGTIQVNGRGWHGGSSHTIDGDNTISWEVNGGGGQTFAGGGTVELRGTFRQATFTGHAAGKTSQIVALCGPIAINGSGGTVNIFGNTGTITDNSSGAVTITSTQAVNLANINTEVDTALNTAIPGSPTSDSINERVAAMDDKLPSRGYLAGSAAATGETQTDADAALAAVNLDHLVGTSSGIPALPAGTYLDLTIRDGTAPYDRTTDSLQAIRDRGDSAWITATSVTVSDKTGFSLANGSIITATFGTCVTPETSNTAKLGFTGSSPYYVQSDVVDWKGATAPAMTGDAYAYLGTNLGALGANATAIPKAGYKLASDGLDTIATTAPTGIASNFREMLVQVWRRFFKKATKTAAQIKTYDDAGTGVVTTQTVSDDGTTETQGSAT